MTFFDDAFYDKIFNIGFGVAGFMVVMGIVSFTAIFIAAIVMIVKSVKKNNKSPCLTVSAKIVSKRTDFSQHRHTTATDSNGLYGYSSDLHTWYYVTFQVDSGDRMEFCIAEYEYGLLIEGDTGKLTFQGTRYISFERF